MNNRDRSTINTTLVKYSTSSKLNIWLGQHCATIRMRKGNTPPSYSLSTSCSLCGNLHSMMSLFSIIPWQLPVPSKPSLPTSRPWQSNLSNLSKGQRPKCSSCIPILSIQYICKPKALMPPNCHLFNHILAV